MLVNYTALEPTYFSALAPTTPGFNGSSSFGEVSSFLFMSFFAVIVAGAFFRYIMAGLYRIQASEAGIRKSNETIKRVTYGLVGVFGLFVLLYTINRGFLESDINLDALKAGGVVTSGGGGTTGGATSQTGGQATGGQGTGSSNQSQRTCSSVEDVKTKLSSSGGVCSGTTCSVLSGCNYREHLSTIKKYAGNDTELQKMAVVILCTESRGNDKAKNTNSNGTVDCGLMQINQQGSSCSNDIMNVETNIKEGVKKIKEKRSASVNNKTYGGVPREGGIFASYNCCANGTIPNNESADCNQQSGFPSPIPKWACPINPGESTYNMCSVKNYVCGAIACMNKVQLQ